MELKFRIRNFSKLKLFLKDNDVIFIGKAVEYYTYLKNGEKLQKTEGNYYLVSIRRHGNFFDLRYKKITKKRYNEILKSEEVLKRIKNRRYVYKLNDSKISLNEMKAGKFVIIEGKKNDIIRLSKKLNLPKKYVVARPFHKL